MPTQRICLIPTCDSPTAYIDYCRAHRHRLRKYGDPLFSPRLPKEVQFWRKVKRGDGCWEWLGSRDKDGYGRFRVGGKGSPTVRASKYAYELTIGTVAKGMLVCHHCDNPSCVRPEHLFIGSHLDNIRDCIAKGRRGHQRKAHLESPIRT